MTGQGWKKAEDAGVSTCRVNGMGEFDRDGSYLMLYVLADNGRHRFKISLGQARCLADQIEGHVAPLREIDEQSYADLAASGGLAANSQQRNDFVIKAMDLMPDRRRMRAAQMCAQIIHIVVPYLCDRHPEVNAGREVEHALYKLFFESGIDFINDLDRAEAGLPPRDARGLTTDELVKIEQARLDAMYRPMSPIIVKANP